MSIAIVRNSTGRVITFVRDDPPSVWQPPEGCSAVPDSELPEGWQYEPAIAPEPTEDTLAGVPVTSDGSVLNIPARIVAAADVQVTDPDRGLVLRDELGHDWLVCITGGALSAVQISNSPEVSMDIRKQRIASARVRASKLVQSNKSKERSKLSASDRLDAIEAIMGINY